MLLECWQLLFQWRCKECNDKRSLHENSQNICFADNQTADKSDKAYKVTVVIRHLKKAFQVAMFDAERQSVDEHMTKFKGWISCKQYKKNKPIKWDFRLPLRVWSLSWQKRKSWAGTRRNHSFRHFQKVRKFVLQALF